MATYLQNLTTSRDNLAAALAAESANPRETYSVDGRSYSWNEYRQSLVTQIDELNALVIKATGAVEIATSIHV